MLKQFLQVIRLAWMGVLFFCVQTHAAIHHPVLKKVPEKSFDVQPLVNSSNFQEIMTFFEKKYGIPGKLLAAIARVESGKSPWAVNAKGRSYHFRTKEKALQFIRALKEKGVKNINVGYMQINLQSHGRKFKNLEDVLAPYHNIECAAKLIKHLYKRYGSWADAIRFYHSGSSYYNVPYQQKVFHAWAQLCR